MTTRSLGFDAACSLETAEILAILASTKPGGRLLELGTGTGLGAAHLLAGMDDSAHLTSVEMDPQLSQVARSVLGSDPRLTLVVEDGEKWLEQNSGMSFDLIFADTWPGKFSALDIALNMVAPGGHYVADDLSPQSNWPHGHQASVDRLVEVLFSLPGWYFYRATAGTGLIVGTRTA